MRFFVLSTLLLASLVASQTYSDASAAAVEAYWRTASLETWPPAGGYLEPNEKLTEANKQLLQIQGTPYGAYQPYLLHTPAYYSLAQVAPSSGLPEQQLKTTALAETTTEEAPTSTTTAKTQPDDEIETLEKLQVQPQTKDDLKSDVGLRSAISKINPNYVIEEILAIPGKHVISTSELKQSLKSQKLRQKMKGRRTPVKVEATGRTSTRTGNIPQIQFGNYFLPYQPLQAQAIQGRKQAALILEPHSKAVVGNGGTAISTPISRALLKKGVPTNVYFNPESVAIAGVGGKAHATADLELDLFT